MKVTRDESPFVPVNIKLETLKEYITVHDLLCFMLEPEMLSKLNNYIRNAGNDVRPCYLDELDTIIRNLKDGLYRVGRTKWNIYYHTQDLPNQLNH